MREDEVDGQLALDELHWQDEAPEPARGGAVAAAGGRTGPSGAGRTLLAPVKPLGAEPALTVVVTPGRLVNPGSSAEPLRIDHPRHVGQLVDPVTEAVGAMFVPAAAFGWLGLPSTLPGPARKSGRTTAARGPASAFLHPFVDDAIAAGWTVEPAGLAWQLRVRRTPTSRPLPVILLPYDDRGVCAPWSTVDDVDELVAGLGAFRAAVGACFGASIGHTGERLLLATHPRGKGGATLDRTPQLPAAIDDVAETGSTWRRRLDVTERAAGHVHWYDANANYLSAYQVANLGRGEPQHHRVDADRLLEGRYPPPGLWRMTLPPLEGEWPAPWSTSAAWHTTPTVVRARELGVDVAAEVVEAWTWPLSSRFTQPFGELMRDARTRLLDTPDTAGGRLALAAVTNVYQRLHGRFAAGFRAGTGSPFYRPDWMHTIRAQARVNLDRRLRTFAAVPFAVDVDAAYYTSDIADPAEFAAAISPADKPMLAPRQQLGRFRVAGTVTLTDDLRDALDDAHTAAATRELLKAAAGGKVEPSTAQPRGRHAARADVDVDDGEDLAELAAALGGER